MKREVTPHLVFTTQAGNRTTIANLTVWIGDQTFEFVGEARCHPDDKFDPEVGARLALGRALESAGNRFQRQADGLVRMHEHNSRHSARARASRAITGGVPGRRRRRETTFQEDGEDILNDSPFPNLDRDTERGREFMDCGPECFPAVGHTKEAGCILAPAAPKPVTMEDLSELGRKIAADVRKVAKEFRKALEDK